jgi:hypothetical protein
LVNPGPPSMTGAIRRQLSSNPFSNSADKT